MLKAVCIGIVVFVSAIILQTFEAQAHEYGLAKAALIELEPGVYRLEGSVPPGVSYVYQPPILPERCSLIGSDADHRAVDGFRFEFKCDTRPLSATDQLRLPWERSGVLLTAQWSDGISVQSFIPRDGETIAIDMAHLQAGSGDWKSTFSRYVSLGVEHILSGADHLAFVLCLCLLASGWRLIKLVTAFTIGHSVTLGLASLGWIALPAPPVEACIALSIVFLANEAISRHSTGHSYLITAGFGLLHGLGFASAIKAIGVGREDILLSLFAFNIGVEIGQILFVAAATSLFFALKRVSLPLTLVQRYVAFSLGSLGMYWTLDRMAGIIDFA